EHLSHMAKQQAQQQSARNTTSVQVADAIEQAAFDHAMQSFRAGQYQSAATEFTQFIETYPKSALVHEARFYRGSSLYAIKDFKGAAAGLQAMLTAAPNDPRAPDALLIIAAAQVDLNDLQGAKASLQ